MNAFELAVLAGLRAAQLQRRSPRVERSVKAPVTARHENAERKGRRATESVSPSGA